MPKFFIDASEIRMEVQIPASFQGIRMEKFASRLPAVEAVTEIKRVARTDPVTAGDGVVSRMERIWPAFQHVDTSSGALGSAVYWAQNDWLPIANRTFWPDHRHRSELGQFS